MPSFSTSRHSIFWTTLLNHGLGSPRNERERRPLHIITPWVSDVPISGCGWTTEMINLAFDGQTANSLVSALIAYRRNGFPVTVTLLSPDGEFLRLGEEHITRHQRIITRLRRGDVMVHQMNNLHQKFLISHDAVLHGSANHTRNGLMYAVENLSLHWRGSREYSDHVRTAFNTIQTWVPNEQRDVLCPMEWLEVDEG